MFSFSRSLTRSRSAKAFRIFSEARLYSPRFEIQAPDHDIGEAKFGSSLMACLKKGIAAAAKSLFHQHVSSQPRAECLKGFKRRRSGLLKWRIEFLNSAERFAQFVPNFRSCLSQGIEHVALVTRLSFRARQ